MATETWGIIVNAGAWTGGGSPVNYQTEMTNFLSARSAQGVTVVMTDPVWSESPNTESSSGNTWDSVTPLAGGSTDPSTAALNSSFWTRVDYLIATAATYGITIGLVLWNNNDGGLGTPRRGRTRSGRRGAPRSAPGMRPPRTWCGCSATTPDPTEPDTWWNYILTGLPPPGTPTR